jgi:hypothetical protein
MEIQDLIRLRQELLKNPTKPLVPALAIDENFIIPTPDSGESEKDYIDRCMAAIGGEYDDAAQAVAVCYAQLKK